MARTNQNIDNQTEVSDQAKIVNVCVVNVNVRRLEAEGINARIENTENGIRIIAEFVGTGDLFDNDCVSELKERFGDQETEAALAKAVDLVNKHLIVSLLTR